jgi:uncharacterized protein (TIGR00369 family)
MLRTEFDSKQYQDAVRSYGSKSFGRVTTMGDEGSQEVGAGGSPHRWGIPSRIPVAELIGFRVTEMANGRSVVLLEAGPQHANPLGTLHGGILCDIADAAMGTAFVSTLAEGESFTTIELKINFLRPVWKAKLKAEAKVVQRGRTIGYVECDVTDENGRLIAKSSSTCLVLRGEKAAGR